ncbi:uncharacterized protein LOC130986892 [Salvia miltiorrhiza]|uniref:uncharacterized protein LOC130986892 n=1 Tax=Salvia miltiorrhiza TaxID=226208 RepID=UPI0025AD0014|nr:uncharacterized protein LOC130986892 [Salvia miltiorrhiza]
MVRVMRKLKRLRSDLRTWNKNVFGNFNEGLASLYADLGALQEDIAVSGYSEESFDNEISIEAKLPWLDNRVVSLGSMTEIATLISIIIWDIIRDDVSMAIRRFFTHGYLPKGLNSSLLILIHKKQDASRVSDYRPIVVSNFFFKIVTKILACRLNIVAADIVHPHKFGFISRGSIHECIRLASEGVNCMEHYLKGRNMAIKVDILKAFYTISWSFILDILSCFGFSTCFCDWIKVIFDFARISVAFNGSLHRYFACSRGVRQGDALSPILFGIAEEVLGRLFSSEADDGFLSRMWFSRTLDFPSYLLYADDVLIFYQASKANAIMIESILEIYDGVSGQLCNREKSSIFFGKGVPVQLRRRIQRALGFRPASLPFIYLGVPIFAGRASAHHLSGLRDRILSTFSRWKGMQLSMAGRICLVSSVVHSSAIHSMMVYHWPARLLRELDTTCRNFIWTGSIRSVPHNSVAWDKGIWHFTLDFIEAHPHIVFDIISTPFSGLHDSRAWVHEDFGQLTAKAARRFLTPTLLEVNWGSWFGVVSKTGFIGTGVTDSGSLVLSAIDHEGSPQLKGLWKVAFISAIWGLWHMRNRTIFDDISPTVVGIVKMIKIFIRESVDSFQFGLMANTVADLLLLHGLAFEAEFFRLVVALERALFFGWSHIWIETDSTFIVELVNSRAHKVLGSLKLVGYA